jgi:hypothetical protein
MPLPTSPQINDQANTPTRHRRRPLTYAFDQEWTRLAAATSTRRSLARWGQSEPVLAPYDDLDDLLAATGHALPEPDADRVLAAVVRRAGEDDLAARVVLHRLLPGLLRVALRRGATGRWRVAPLFDELTAAGWIVVRTYPIDRRPAKIAVNLLRDAEYEVCVRPFRRRAAAETPSGTFLDDELLASLVTDATGRPDHIAWHPSDELAHVLAQGRAAAVPTDDLDLLRSLYLEAEPVQEAARRLAVSPRTVLSRRLAATRRLRVVAA